MQLNLLDIGEDIWLVNNDRHWAKIDEIHIYKDEKDNLVTLYSWVQIEHNVNDPDEVWDEGSFDSTDVGKIVLVESLHADLIKEEIEKINREFIKSETEF